MTELYVKTDCFARLSKQGADRGAVVVPDAAPFDHEPRSEHMGTVFRHVRGERLGSDPFPGLDLAGVDCGLGLAAPDEYRAQFVLRPDRRKRYRILEFEQERELAGDSEFLAQPAARRPGHGFR